MAGAAGRSSRATASRSGLSMGTTMTASVLRIIQFIFLISFFLWSRNAGITLIIEIDEFMLIWFTCFLKKNFN